MKPGELFFLTEAYEKYVYERNPDLRLRMVNRLAKLEEIIDWKSEKGQKIKQARIDSGKWNDLPLEDNKYLFSVYYHDLKGRNGQQGTVERGLPMFSKDPKTGEPFFVPVPDWEFREIMKECEKIYVMPTPVAAMVKKLKKDVS